ncbi:MAG: hypothetical protein CVT47_04085 [Thermoplasmata archaeon HGW-Thermoplasmata-2]|nr:MAG: hypothetical protein CVT47_04085 [Thermoplasmata archaeon HGW-Thermoplasmata-2]
MTGSLGETKKVEFDMAWESGFDGVISGATRATVWLGGKAVEAPEPSPVGGAGASVQSYHVYDTAEFPESITIMLKQ